ncbi:metal-independent alpha-mannosidase [Terrimonas sp.]|uniref:glycoside hydrolase family 125 protein n=1 Tax=Terrimonas sp. TaxID=1914338 RepID=UPI000D50D117|nr:glycoside hydrolase family 125 protein [Terrimonas sp.]PVD51461.1 metal-independent alpha-mannosidase [Terrimonas sp.]
MLRRQFIQQSTLAAAGIAASGKLYAGKPDFPVVRIAESERKFRSAAVEKTIAEVKKNIGNKEIAWLFENCFPNTLDTTVVHKTIDDKPDTFVITGDIHAMWLRDSTAQVWPYISLIKEDKALQQLVAGVINRQNACIIIDPYANAFNDGPTGSEWDKDHTAMKPELHERKWEIDSLCYPVRLAYHYWKITGDSSPFDERWKQAMQLIVKTFREQQRKKDKGPYTFGRTTSWSTDTVPGNGYGNPVKPVGLIVSVFRPSDDATIFPFLVPANFFAVASLRQLAEMNRAIVKDETFAKECSAFADEVEKALQQYAVAAHSTFGKIYAYEVDGFGNHLFMDDSNVPSLLALPYFSQLKSSDPVYQNTRRFVLSDGNPYFFKGLAGEGVGSPHTLVDNIWPIGVTIRGLTSNSDAEIKECLSILQKTHAGTGFMHESFNKDDASKFTRKWFAWANTLFGEFVLKTYREKPYLLR